MAFNILQKFIQTIRLEVAKKGDPNLVNLLEKARMKKPILTSEVKIVEKDGEIEVFNKSNMKLLSLPKQCKDILDMCNGFNTVEEISQKIYKRKILKRKFLEDVILFLNDLAKEEFIVWK
jgi:hypothetical protein